MVPVRIKLAMIKRRQASESKKRLLLERFDHQCFGCGTELNAATITVDHLMPVRLRGGNKITNLVPSCRECNAGKGSRYPTLDEIDRAAAAHGERYINPERMKEVEGYWQANNPDLSDIRMPVTTEGQLVLMVRVS